MKKIFLLLAGILLLFSVTFVACKKSETQPQNGASEVFPHYKVATQANKPKLKFKHTKKGTPGNPNPPFCTAPLGICITFGAQAIATDYKFTATERADAIGTAKLSMENDTHLKMIPDTQFAYIDGTIEMQGDLAIDRKLANQMGYNSITIKKGTYRVNANEGDYGSVIVSVSSN